MPVISFTASDALQTKVVEPAYYTCEISEIKGPQKSKSGKSYSYYVDVMILEGPYKGKTRTIVLNSETSSYSQLGEMQFYPMATFLEIDSVINGREVKAEDYQLDTDMLLHKPFDTKWGIGTEDGHIFNTVDTFHPAGYGASAPSF